MPIRLPQGNIAITDLICERITFNDDGSVISGLDPFTPTRIVLPLADTPLLPTLAWGDGDSGFYQEIDNRITASAAGIAQWNFAGNGLMQSEIVGGWLLRCGQVASAVNPTICPNDNDINTGLGSVALDQLSLIAGGVRVANLTEAAGVVQFIVPLQNLEATPSIAFGDGDTGFFETANDQLTVSINGTARWDFAGGSLQARVAGGPGILNEATTAVNPTLVPNIGDPDSGIGSPGLDQISLVAGALDCINISEAGAVRQIGFYVTAPIALQTGVAVSSAGIHAALVALGLITA